MHLQNCPQFQLFLEHIPAAIAMFDHQMRYIAASRRWLTDYGFRQESLTGCYHYEVFPDTPEKWKAVHQRTLAGFVESGEADSIVRSDGSLEWVKWESNPWYDQNGEIGGTVFFFEVITQRKQAEQAFLKASEARFQKLAANLSGVIYQFVLRSDGTQYCSYISPSCRELLELEPEEIQQDISCIFNLYDPDDLPGIHQSVLVSAQTLQPYNEQHRIITPSGKMKWLQLISCPERQANGDVIWDGVLIDITKRRLAEEESQKLISLVENSSDFIAIATLNGQGVFVNEAGRKLVGLTSSEQVKQKMVSDYHTPEDWEYLQQQILPVVMEQGCWRGESRFRHFQTGALIAVDYNIFVIKNHTTGQPIALATITRDITQHKQASEALRQSEARYRELAQREQLLNRLASQIRNTLDLNTILETAVQEIRRLLQIERCHFAWYLPEPDEGYWEIVKEDRAFGVADLTGRYSAANFGLFAQKLLQMEMLRVADVEMVEDCVWREFVRDSLGLVCVLALPFRTLSGTVGVISCTNSHTARLWSDQEVELLQAVVQQLAIAINQAELYTQAQQAAITAQNQALQLEKTLEELKRTQTQLVQSEKMSSLGQLVAGVAHEINNPVNFIFGNLAHAAGYIEDLLGLLKLYQQTYPEPTPEIEEEIDAIDLDFLIIDMPKLLSSMKVGADRIREIVRSLRNFSRHDESQMKAVDIHEGIDSTLMILQNRLKPRPDHPGIEVIKNYGHLPLVECYAGQMNQVFMNVLANAIDALEEHSSRDNSAIQNSQLALSATLCLRNNSPNESKISNPQIHIRTQVLNNERVAIYIADNGSGMTPEVKERLFEPFFTTKPVGVGTGLGLLISYQIIVEKHGGQLLCFSELGKGTQFVIEIPILQPSK